jgi:hypothetical protein
VGYLLWVPLTPASFVVVAGALPHASLVTWHSCAAGLPLVNAGDEGGGLLTLHPGGVAGGWEVRMAGRSGGGGGKKGKRGNGLVAVSRFGHGRAARPPSGHIIN